MLSHRLSLVVPSGRIQELCRRRLLVPQFKVLTRMYEIAAIVLHAWTAFSRFDAFSICIIICRNNLHEWYKLFVFCLQLYILCGRVRTVTYLKNLSILFVNLKIFHQCVCGSQLDEAVVGTAYVECLLVNDFQRYTALSMPVIYISSWMITQCVNCRKCLYLSFNTQAVVLQRTLYHYSI